MKKKEKKDFSFESRMKMNWEKARSLLTEKQWDELEKEIDRTLGQRTEEEKKCFLLGFRFGLHYAVKTFADWLPDFPG